jgi:hypothetical protein
MPQPVYWSLLTLNATVVKEGVYQLLVQIWLNIMVFLTATRPNLTVIQAAAYFSN